MESILTVIGDTMSWVMLAIALACFLGSGYFGIKSIRSRETEGRATNKKDMRDVGIFGVGFLAGSLVVDNVIVRLPDSLSTIIRALENPWYCGEDFIEKVCKRRRRSTVTLRISREARWS